jgi:CRP/FNR family transcriptional regulator
MLSLQNASTLSGAVLRDFHSIGTCRQYKAQEVLIREGFPADHLLIVYSGRVKLVTSSTEGRLLILRIAGPGDFLGLAALLQKALYFVTAETLEPCIIKSIPHADFTRFMTTYPDVGYSIVHALAREYSGAVLTARRLALHTSAAGKLASTLLDLARVDELDNSPAQTNLPISFPMPLTHEELGSMAGLSRETVSRLLTRFRREGHVHQIHDRMTLNHPNQLETRYC